MIIGYTCSYIPVEIMHAAGVFPYRIGARESRETTLADAVMSSITCSFARCCLELVLRGEYKFLDGLVFMNGCENMRRMCDNMTHKIDFKFVSFISVPYKTDVDAIEWYMEELNIFKGKLEKFVGARITNEKLRKSIEIFNKTRQLLKRLYELRRSVNPPLTGTEVQDIVVMGNAMPREEYNRLLEKMIARASERKGLNNYRARLMIVGNMLDDSTYTKAIEESGGLVVTDASCFGGLSFWKPIEVTGDPIGDIVRAYLGDFRCPRMPDKQIQMCRLIKEMVEKFGVDGVIFERMMHCNLWCGETIALEKISRELNIPLLIVDREYIPSGLGQLRTKIQAFLEMIMGDKK